jgi:hypothetical protein
VARYGTFDADLRQVTVFDDTALASGWYSADLIAAGPHTFTQAVAGTLSFLGAETRIAQKALAGAVAFVGALSPMAIFFKIAAGVVSFLGATAEAATHVETVAGVLNFAGAVQKTTQKMLAGALSSAADIARSTQKALAGGLTFSSSLLPAFLTTVAGVLTFLGQLVGVLQVGGGVSAEPAGKLTTLHWMNLLRTITVVLLALLF